MRALIFYVPAAIAVAGLCIMISGKLFCQKGSYGAKAVFWWSYCAVISGVTIQAFIWICERGMPITELAITSVVAIFLGGYLSQKDTRSQKMPKSLIFWGGIIATAALFFCMVFAGKEMFPRG
ncbi:MAG: hypothetical protein WC227_01140 [Patescibacteria group bacterium]|jgi:hypothetical protein